MKYERSLFGMKISDAMSLSKCVRATDTLSSLCLPCNVMDDDLLRMLMTGLVHNQVSPRARCSVCVWGGGGLTSWGRRR